MALVPTSTAQSSCALPTAGTLQAADAQLVVTFGATVAAEGDLLVVGAPDSFGGFQALTAGAGAVHTFQRQGDSWVAQAPLYVLDGFPFDRFGSSLFLAENQLLVGAENGDRVGRTDTGAAYLFEREGEEWIQRAKFMGSDTQRDDAFGTGLAIRNNMAVIGAPQYSGEVFHGGAAYVFRHDGTHWNEVAKLLPPDPTGNDNFGHSVLIVGNDIVVGAPRHLAIGNSSRGALYVFRDDGAGFTLRQKLAPQDVSDLRRLGLALVQDGAEVIATAASLSLVLGLANGVWEVTTVLPEGGASAAVHGDWFATGGTAGGFSHFPTLPAVGFLFHRTAGVWQRVGQFGSAGITATALTDGFAFAGNPSVGSPHLNAGGVFLVDAIWHDCNENDILDECDIVTGSSSDCNRNGIPDECDIAEGTSLDECTNGIPDECEPDCNGNGVVDTCELAEGTSTDCNDNAIPDECELARGWDLDCNANGVLDACDLADGTVSNCGHNQRIDECLYQHRYFLVSGSYQSTEFAKSVDINEYWSIFGFPDDSPNGVIAAGSAHVQRDSWFFGYQRLIAADAAPSAYFGTSVAVDGGAAVVGAPQAREGTGPHTGAAYVFHWNYDHWTQNAKLTAPDAQAGAYMGYSVALKGLVAVVGAPLHLSKCDHGGCTRWGAVYVFTRDPSGWTFQQRLTAWDGSPAALFGFALAFDGDYIVVGAPADQLLPFSPDSVGAAYVFRRDGDFWVPDVKLMASDGHPLNSFGTSVSLSGARVLVGAPGTLGPCSPAGNCHSGAAYSYRWDGAQWLEEAKWIDFDPADGDAFGSAVALQGLQALVATRDEILPGETRSAVHAFWRTGGEWRFRARLWANPPVDRLGSDFGASLAMHGSWALIGSPGTDGVTGAGHFYPLGVPSCYCPAEEVRFIDPPAGTVDARQPHPPDHPTTGQNATVFTMSGPDHASGQCWQYCVERFDGSSDSTYSRTIEANGEGITTLQLNRPSAFGPIPPGSTFRVAYVPRTADATVTHYFTHPGDVNADGWANARDILALIDILNGVRTPRFGNYSADINHSGEVGLSDLTRLIDLLNGAGAYDPWINTRRPAPQWCP